jgi:hypothetical protein
MTCHTFSIKVTVKEEGRESDNFFKGMTGALASFSYLVHTEQAPRHSVYRAYL